MGANVVKPLHVSEALTMCARYAVPSDRGLCSMYKVLQLVSSIESQ